MSGRKTFAPPVRRIQPSASLEDMRAAVIELQEYHQTREPEQAGDPLDKIITWRDAVHAGLAEYSLGTPGGSGPGGGVFRPPPRGGLGGWDDLTPPDPLDNLAVTSIPTGFFVEFDAPIYRQGGGNAYSIIYQANYSGAGPLPTFSSAVEVGRITERGVILVIAAEPGVQGHFWAQPVSFAEDYNRVSPQTPPTGGTNGVSAVAGQLSNDHIANLSAGKLTAGTIGVSEHIESTGYDPGVYGWMIEGDGDAEFNNVVVRGTIYATAGLIGGAVIDSDGVESDNYVAGASGWRLDNGTGTIYAQDIVLGQGSATVYTEFSTYIDTFTASGIYVNISDTIGTMSKDVSGSAVTFHVNGNVLITLAAAGIASGNHYLHLYLPFSTDAVFGGAGAALGTVHYRLKLPIANSDQFVFPVNLTVTIANHAYTGPVQILVGNLVGGSSYLSTGPTGGAFVGVDSVKLDLSVRSVELLA